MSVRRNIIATAVLLIAVATSAFAASAVEKLLPTGSSVKSWSVMADSLQYGKGKSLVDIYNGGYELYTDRGVVDAARQMYKQGDKYIEVVIHTMKSEKAAADFLNYWQKENKIKSLSKSKSSSYFVITKPNTAVYFTTKNYFTIANAFHSGDQARKDVVAFMEAIDSRIAPPRKR